VAAALAYREAYTFAFQFLVDSGAQLSFAPKNVIRSIYPEIQDAHEVDSGCLDIQRKPIFGVPLQVQVSIDGLPPVPQEMWFSNGVMRAVLGHSFFDKVDVRFRYFLPDREFHLESPPNLAPIEG
jgi:hypothetical protein